MTAYNYRNVFTNSTSAIQVGLSLDAAFFSKLQPASFRGVPFGVSGSTLKAGRKNAVHEYPFKDKPWVEDLGRQGRRISIIGFIVGDQNGTALDKRDQMVGAIETNDTGELVHPTLGRLKVSVLDFDVEERMEEGGCFTLRFVFMESGDKQFPAVALSTANVTAAAVKVANTSAIAALVARVVADIQYGEAVIAAIQVAATQFVSLATAAVYDAASLYHAIVNLPGSLEGLFGRFFSGNIFNVFGNSYGSANTSTQNPNATIASLIAISAVNRETVNSAQATTESSAGDPNALGLAAQAFMASVANAAANPNDALRLLLTFTTFEPTTYVTTAPIGTSVNDATDAAGDAFRRAAVIALAQASLFYQPSSADDAIVTRNTVCAALDAEIEVAGDQGEDDMFTSLRALRAAVSDDFTNRGANLAPIKTFSSNSSISAPQWALRIYRDVTRSDELIGEVMPVHPLFMPTSFRALAE